MRHNLNMIVCYSSDHFKGLFHLGANLWRNLDGACNLPHVRTADASLASASVSVWRESEKESQWNRPFMLIYILYIYTYNYRCLHKRSIPFRFFLRFRSLRFGILNFDSIPSQIPLRCFIGARSLSQSFISSENVPSCCFHPGSVGDLHCTSPTEPEWNLQLGTFSLLMNDWLKLPIIPKWNKPFR